MKKGIYDYILKGAGCQDYNLNTLRGIVMLFDLDPDAYQRVILAREFLDNWDRGSVEEYRAYKDTINALFHFKDYVDLDTFYMDCQSVISGDFSNLSDLYLRSCLMRPDSELHQKLLKKMLDAAGNIEPEDCIKQQVVDLYKVNPFALASFLQGCGYESNVLKGMVRWANDKQV